MEATQKRSTALYSLAFAGAVVVWYVILHDPAYQGVLRRIALFTSPPASLALPDSGIAEAKDPPVATAFPHTGVALQMRTMTPSNAHGYLLVGVGDCVACTKIDLRKLYNQTRKRHIALLVFSTGEAENVRQTSAIYSRDGMNIPFYRDINNKLSETLNSYYPGRMYYYTPDWKLRWREQGANVDNYLFETGRFDRVMENTKS